MSGEVVRLVAKGRSRDQGTLGLFILVDAKASVFLGIDMLLTESLEALGLSRTNVASIPDDGEVREAIGFRNRLDARTVRKSPDNQTLEP